MIKQKKVPIYIETLNFYKKDVYPKATRLKLATATSP